MDTNVIHEVLEKTQAGKMVFPEVVRRLSEIGVESYLCDYAAGRETFYSVGGTTYTENTTLPPATVAENFSPTELVTAIRGAQADTIRYPEFRQRSAAAGVIGYWAFLAGEKVIYFGRKGESHTEVFPGAKS